MYTYILTTPPLPPFPLGQQCSSLVVSIIIIQSAFLSTRNCQPSTNTGPVINAIPTLVLFPPLLLSLCVSFLVSCYQPLFQSTQLSSCPVICCPSLPIFLNLPSPLFWAPTPFSCLSPLFLLWLPPDECGDDKNDGKGREGKKRKREEACIIGFLRCDRERRGRVVFLCLSLCVCWEPMK